MVQAEAIPPVRLLAVMGLPPTTSRKCCSPWSVFQDGSNEDLSPASWGCRSMSGASFTPWSPRRHRRSINLRFYPARETHADQHSAHTTARERRISLSAHTASIRFPLNNFKHFLTLFSKFFSSFPHGTCSLSVSRQYLALEGIYLPLRAAFPNNPTRGKHLVE